jgi:hypothetical protein
MPSDDDGDAAGSAAETGGRRRWLGGIGNNDSSGVGDAMMAAKAALPLCLNRYRSISRYVYIYCCIYMLHELNTYV